MVFPTVLCCVRPVLRTPFVGNEGSLPSGSLELNTQWKCYKCNVNTIKLVFIDYILCPDGGVLRRLSPYLPQFWEVGVIYVL